MTIAAIEDRSESATRAAFDAVPLWVWTLIALIVATGLTVLSKGVGRAFEFVDSDDALRLIHVRDLVGGASWFEVTTGALGGKDGLVSHWSRLIDGPMAVLLVLLRLVLPETAAQAALVTIWPMLMLGATLWAIARATEEAHGRGAALLALLFGATSVLAYYQFAPGRIDHHNVMIATTVAAVLVIWAAPHSMKAWRLSGALCAIALAIGYEALAPVAVIAALAGGWGLLQRDKALLSAAFVEALVAVLAIVLVATIPPGRWLSITCDALSLNLLAMAGAAGLGFIAVMRHGDAWSWPAKIGVLAVGGAVGVTLFGWLDPTCLAGPMGQVPSGLWPVWMGHVEEAKSLLREFFSGNVSSTAAPLLIFAAGLAASAFTLARTPRHADRLLLATAGGFVLLAVWQMKYLAYASLILAPGLALLVLRLPSLGELRAPIVRLAAVLMLNQFALLAMAGTLVAKLGSAGEQSVETAGADAATATQACTMKAALEVLGAAPAGLVITHNDIGAHLATATHHRALSGPYHRIPVAIITNHAVLSAKDPATAGRLLGQEGADYVLSCRPLDRAQLARQDWNGSLLAALDAGNAPAFLAPVPLESASLYRLWRVDRARLPKL